MVFSQNTQTYYHIEETLIEILVSHPSLIPEYLAPLHSCIPEIFLEVPTARYRCVPCAFYKNCRAQILVVNMSRTTLGKGLLYKTFNSPIVQTFIKCLLCLSTVRYRQGGEGE